MSTDFRSADNRKLFGFVINCNTYMDVSRETLNLKPNNLSPDHTRRDSSPQHKNITKKNKIFYLVGNMELTIFV